MPLWRRTWHRAASHPGRGWTLRRRLVVLITVLVAGVVTTVGVASTLALRHTLLVQLDSQLQKALSGPALANPPLSDIDTTTGATAQPQADRDGLGRDGPGRGERDGHRGPGARLGALTAVRAADGTYTAAQIVTDDGRVVDISAHSAALDAVFAKRARTLREVDSRQVDIPGSGQFLVRMAQRADGSAVIAGQSLEPLSQTVRSNIVFLIGIGLAATALAGGVGAWLVTRSLAPLRRVAATATRVAGRDLVAADVAIPERLSGPDTDPRTEVGQVGSSLNTLLNHIENALIQRQRSEDKLRQFVADASHELRTPLAAIRGYAALSRRLDVDVPPQLAQPLERIESESERMTNLVEELLLLARLDAGATPTRTAVDLGELATTVVADLYMVEPQRDWGVDIPATASAEELTVRADRGQIQQVLVNLLANARAHTPVSAAVTVQLRPRAEAVEIAVTDLGPGIDPQLQARLFDRFVRGEEARTGPSTGLGLAISQAIIAAHGGSIAVQSRPGQTTFTVTLPR